jgi:hypothetical protein
MAAQPDGAQAVPARIGGVGVYATSAALVATHRTRGERAVLAVATVAGCWLLAPLAFLIPPYIEPGLAAMLLGLYFGRRAWVGEWRVVSLGGVCPRCDVAIPVKPGTMLYLPHTLHCRACRAEVWLEMEPAAEVAPEVRAAAREQAAAPSSRPVGGRPLTTWSPAGSDWRDRPRRRP